jgi:hypothetical protein
MEQPSPNSTTPDDDDALFEALSNLNLPSTGFDHVLWMNDQELAEKGGEFLEALKHLDDEGTPEESAECNDYCRRREEKKKRNAYVHHHHHQCLPSLLSTTVQKDLGNKAFKKGKTFFGEAIRYYTLAIHRGSSDKQAVSVYYCNRAEVNRQLGRVIDRVKSKTDKRKINHLLTPLHHHHHHRQLRSRSE